MNKFSFLLSAILLFIFQMPVHSQVLTTSNVKDYVMQSNINHNQINDKGKIVNLSELNGSPYWNKEFAQGKILIKKGDKVKTITVFIRYRIFDDIFEVKKTKTAPDSKILDMQRSTDLEVKLAHTKFEFLKHLPVEIRGVRNGYAIVLVSPRKDTDEATLYKRMSQILIPAKAPSNPYDKGKKASLREKDYYFVKIDGRLYQIEPHHRKAYRGFPDHNKDLKKYISKNRLKFRGDNKDSDMIRLVNYYNGL